MSGIRHADLVLTGIWPGQADAGGDHNIEPQEIKSKIMVLLTPWSLTWSQTTAWLDPTVALVIHAILAKDIDLLTALSEGSLPFQEKKYIFLYGLKIQ